MAAEEKKGGIGGIENGLAPDEEKVARAGASSRRGKARQGRAGISSIGFCSVLGVKKGNKESVCLGYLENIQF